MTRVVVQRGGLSNQTQSRPSSVPPSNSASGPPSAPGSSSTTPSQNTQSPILPIPSPLPMLSSESISSASNDEFLDVSESEAQSLEGEPQTLVVGDASGKSASYALLSDVRGNSEAEPAVSRAQCSGNLEIDRADTPERKGDDMVRQLQQVVVSEKLPDVAEVCGDVSNRGKGLFNIDENSEGESSDYDNQELKEECQRLALLLSGPPSTWGNIGREQSGKISPPQMTASTGRNTPLANSGSSVSSSSMASFYYPPGLQAASHASPLPPVPMHHLPAASSDPLLVPRTHEENDSVRLSSITMSSEAVGCSQVPAPIPLAPPAPLTLASSRRGGWVGSSASSAIRGPTSRRIPRASKSTRSSPNSSRPTSPRSYGEGDGYNSADEQNPWTPGPSGYEDSVERERQFDIELRRVKGLEVRHMAEDGNCLFRAVADRVYGDAEMYDETRQMCIDYMEKERDHFSQFVTESFTAYCKRKRRDKVYGNNLEIQAMAEIYNRPIHIYSYTTEPINIFHGNYETDLPPIRLSYHRGNHYNSIVDPRNPAVGAGLGFGSLRGRNVDTEQVKAALNAQQEQQIDKALLAEGRFYSDMELTEQEIERMVMEASRAEYMLGETRRRVEIFRESNNTSTSAGAEPSSSRTTESAQNTSDVMDSMPLCNIPPITRAGNLPATSAPPNEGCILSDNTRLLLSMGFSYLRVMEAHSIFGDNINNILCYLLETETQGPGGENVRRKGKAAE